jgi:hypothetical protein
MFSDLLPMTLLSAVDDLEQIRVSEIGDYARYPVEYVMRLWGFGAKPDEVIPLFEGRFIRDLWEPVVRYLARQLQVELDEIRVRINHELAPRHIPTACYTVEKGTVGAVRFEVIGVRNGHEVVVVEHINFVHQDVCPHWPLGKDGKHTVYRIEVKGRPPLRCEVDLDYIEDLQVDGGLVATAMRAINAIPLMHDARPGVLSPPRSAAPAHTQRSPRRERPLDMGSYSINELREAYRVFSRVSDECAESGDYNAFADLFTEDCEYNEHAFGKMRGREAVREWIVPLMRMWPNIDMRYSHDWVVFDEEHGRIVFCARTYMVDPGDGSHHSETNWTAIDYAGDGLFSREEDIYNPANFATMLVAWQKAKDAASA